MLRGRQPWLFAALIAATLAVFFEVHLNVSLETSAAYGLERLSPDAKLYYGLAENLVDGTGFHDTLRKREILPPIGHPLWLVATWHVAGWSPALQSHICIWLSVGLMIVCAVL